MEFWKIELNINDVNTPGIGANIITSGNVTSAKLAFFFRYNYPAHYQRHQKLQHFDCSCPLCGNSFGTPKHIIFECQGELCNENHQNVFTQAVQNIQQFYLTYNIQELMEEERILIATGSNKMDYTTATTLQQSFATIHRLWCKYDANREKSSTIARFIPISSYYIVTSSQQVIAMKQFYEATTHQDKLTIFNNWSHSDKTLMRWYKRAVEEKAIPENALSVKKHLQFYKEMDIAISYYKCNDKSSRDKVVKDSGVTISQVQKYVVKAKKNGFIQE